jgi:hypothetical protein
VPGAGGGADRSGQSPLLALRLLAALHLGKLATAGAAQLPPLRRPLLLVPLQEKC